MTSDDYKNMFPGEPLASKSDKKNTSKNSGKHMKDEKYKKMFSDKIKGDKNPNHKSNTTEYERKKRSPFSSEFVKYTSEEERLEFIERAGENRLNTTQLEYWINKGYSQEDAIKLRSERQSTFSLESCV